MEILCNRDAPIKLALQINCNSTTNIFLLLTRYIKSHSRESFPQQWTQKTNNYTKNKNILHTSNATTTTKSSHLSTSFQSFFNTWKFNQFPREFLITRSNHVKIKYINHSPLPVSPLPPIIYTYVCTRGIDKIRPPVFSKNSAITAVAVR